MTLCYTIIFNKIIWCWLLNDHKRDKEFYNIDNDGNKDDTLFISIVKNFLNSNADLDRFSSNFALISAILTLKGNEIDFNAKDQFGKTVFQLISDKLEKSQDGTSNVYMASIIKLNDTLNKIRSEQMILNKS